MAIINFNDGIIHPPQSPIPLFGWLPDYKSNCTIPIKAAQIEKTIVKHYNKLIVDQLTKSSQNKLKKTKHKLLNQLAEALQNKKIRKALRYNDFKCRFMTLAEGEKGILLTTGVPLKSTPPTYLFLSESEIVFISPPRPLNPVNMQLYEAYLKIFDDSSFPIAINRTRLSAKLVRAILDRPEVACLIGNFHSIYNSQKDFTVTIANDPRNPNFLKIYKNFGTDEEESHTFSEPSFPQSMFSSDIVYTKSTAKEKRIVPKLAPILGNKIEEQIKKLMP